MFLRDKEEELWREKTNICRGEGKSNLKLGNFIATNQRLIFEVEKKALFGMVKMSKEVIWEAEHDDVKDITTEKKKLLGRMKVVIKTINKNRFTFGQMGPENAVEKLKDTIRGSLKSEREKEYEKKKELAKASASVVNVNMNDEDEEDEDFDEEEDYEDFDDEDDESDSIVCFACSESIEEEDIEWIAPGKFRCPYCRAKNSRRK